MSDLNHINAPSWTPSLVLGLYNPEAKGWSCLGTTQAGRRCQRHLSQSKRDQIMATLPMLSSSQPTDLAEEKELLWCLSFDCLCHDHDYDVFAKVVVNRWERALRKARTAESPARPKQLPSASPDSRRGSSRWTRLEIAGEVAVSRLSPTARKGGSNEEEFFQLQYRMEQLEIKSKPASGGNKVKEDEDSR